MNRVLITGAGGQLGKALAAITPPQIQTVSAERAVLDITNRESVMRWCEEHSPAGIVNAAAYTAVDQAESEPKLARAANTLGPKNLALAAKEHGIPLIHVSTDFVFNGKSGDHYKPTDSTDPLSVYGVTKRDGEQAVMAVEGVDAAIVRTAWVYDSEGKNFVTTMLKLMQEKDSLGVVADQIGSPTYVYGLATACWGLYEKKQTGIYHWTDSGVASWYDFAVAIQEEALELGILKSAIPIKPLTTADFPTPAVRPSNSLLDKSLIWEALGETSPHWRSNLRKALDKYKLMNRSFYSRASTSAFVS